MSIFNENMVCTAILMTEDWEAYKELKAKKAE